MTIHAQTNELQTVPYMDRNQYMSKWYNIASFPQSFRKACSCTTAAYSLNDGGSVAVVNQCNKNGKLEVSKGKTVVTDQQTNANYP